MDLANESNTQVYSPLGSYVVEQRGKGRDHGQRFLATKFEVADLPSQRKAGDVLSNEQAAVSLGFNVIIQFTLWARHPQGCKFF